MAISRLSIIKFLELTLTCVCIGLHHNSFNCGNINLSMITTGTFVGFIIILAGCAAGYLLQTPINRRIDVFFSITGCALFVTAGALLIEEFKDYGKSDLRDKQLAKAAMAIINGAIFLVDALLTYRGE